MQCITLVLRGTSKYHALFNDRFLVLAGNQKLWSFKKVIIRLTISQRFCWLCSQIFFLDQNYVVRVNFPKAIFICIKIFDYVNPGLESVVRRCQVMEGFGRVRDVKNGRRRSMYSSLFFPS